MEYLILDGYNIINTWTDLFHLESESLEECRLRLLDILANYQGYKKNKIVVVFDGHMRKGNYGTVERYGNVEVVYTRENETADQYIERRVYQESRDNVIYVVTGDYLEQITVFHGGGARMTARELRREIDTVNEQIRKTIQKPVPQTNKLGSHLSPEIAAKLEKMRRGNY